MEKKSIGKRAGAPASAGDQERASKKPARKTTEYGRQLEEKQKVKEMYGLREQQFRRFYSIAERSKEATGEMLLVLLERRLDNVLYRLKLATTRAQARQVIVHGLACVNGARVSSPSYLVSVNDVVTLSESALKKQIFLEQVVDKRLNTGIKVPDWLEIDKKSRKGAVLRMPIRSDVQSPIEEHLIIELYSK